MANITGTFKIYGGQVCDYVYFTKQGLDDAQAEAAENNDVCPPWDINTVFAVTFDNGLIAGNASTGSQSILGYDVYREKSGEDLVYIGTTDAVDTDIIDYGVGNQWDVRYYIYPKNENYLGTPFVTDWLHTKFYGWQLLVCDPTEVANSYNLAAIYLFDFNLANTNLQNNTTINKFQNFTQYLKIQRNRTNCWSGQLSALLGRYVYNYDQHYGYYFENISMVEAIRTLSTETRDMFLRDYDGFLFRVQVTSPVQLAQSQHTNMNEHTVTIEWTEVGSADGVMITDVNG